MPRAALWRFAGQVGADGYAAFAVGAFAARGETTTSPDGEKAKVENASTARGFWGDEPPAGAFGVAATRGAARAAGGATASDEFADMALKLACVALGAAAGPVLAEPGGMAAALAEAVLGGVASARRAETRPDAVATSALA